MAELTGTVGILNVGAGDIKLTFDKSNPVERIRSARIVRDMLRRGYALLIEVKQADGSTQMQRALDFDEGTAEYIIADLDPQAAEPSAFLKTTDERETDEKAGEAPADGDTAAGAKAQPARRGRPRKAVSADTVRAVAVARTAGG